MRGIKLRALRRGRRSAFAYVAGILDRAIVIVFFFGLRAFRAIFVQITVLVVVKAAAAKLFLLVLLVANRVGFVKVGAFLRVQVHIGKVLQC